MLLIRYYSFYCCGFWLYLSLQLNLTPVLRLSPPWGQSHYRDMSDDANHLVYTTLAQAFKAVVASLPMKAGQNVYLQIDNEPDLCYEWFCGVPGSPLSFQQMATEYAHFLQYVLDALHSLRDSRIKISHGALAPGGALQCGCCGQSSCGSSDKPGITGLQYMQAMMGTRVEYVSLQGLDALLFVPVQLPFLAYLIVLIS